MYETERIEALTVGLVGEHTDLYRNSPSFKVAIDALARQLLPPMVSGIAAEAKEQERRWSKRLEEVLLSPPAPLFIPRESLDEPPE